MGFDGRLLLVYTGNNMVVRVLVSHYKRSTSLIKLKGLMSGKGALRGLAGVSFHIRSK